MYVCVCIYVCVHINMRSLMYVLYICTVYVYVCMYSMYVYMYVCMYERICPVL
jgi:hypothetical protein